MANTKTTVYPTAVDARSDPAPSASQQTGDNNLTHSQMHSVFQDATVALEKIVGVTSATTASTGTPSLDCTNVGVWLLTLTGNVTGITTTNEGANKTLTIVITQDGTGGRTYTFGTKFKLAGAVAVITPVLASHRDVFRFVYDTNLSAWVEVARAINVG